KKPHLLGPTSVLGNHCDSRVSRSREKLSMEPKVKHVTYLTCRNISADYANTPKWTTARRAHLPKFTQSLPIRAEGKNFREPIAFFHILRFVYVLRRTLSSGSSQKRHKA